MGQVLVLRQWLRGQPRRIHIRIFPQFHIGVSSHHLIQRGGNAVLHAGGPSGVDLHHVRRDVCPPWDHLGLYPAASVWAFRPSLKSGVIPKQTRTASRMHTAPMTVRLQKNILVQFDTSICSDLKCKSSQPVGGHTAEAEKRGQGQAHHRQRLFFANGIPPARQAPPARGKDGLYQPPHAQDKSAGPHQLHITAADGKPIPFYQDCRQQEEVADQKAAPPQKRQGGTRSARTEGAGPESGLESPGFAYPTRRRTGAAGQTAPL